jgi:ribosome-associated protein
VRNRGQLKEKEIVDLAKSCARLLDEKKARDTVIVNLMKIHSYLDYFVISTANSLIHCRSLAREVRELFKNAGLNERSRTQAESAWIGLDYSEIVVHIFTKEMRDYYQLEKLWADADKIVFR